MNDDTKGTDGKSVGSNDLLGDKSAPYTEHHIWCNFWGTPVETCWQCKGLYKEYPMDGMSGDELQQKYFPNVIKREGT